MIRDDKSCVDQSEGAAQDPELLNGPKRLLNLDLLALFVHLRGLTLDFLMNRPANDSSASCKETGEARDSIYMAFLLWDELFTSGF